MMHLKAVAALAVFVLPFNSISAAQSQSSAMVEGVISSNPDPDGKTYTLSLMLDGGRQLALRVRPAEAVKIVDGLSKAAGPGSQKGQVAALVQGISIQADAQGKFVLLQPRTSAGATDPLAIPIEGAERFIQLLQQKAAEARANLSKQHN